MKKKKVLSLVVPAYRQQQTIAEDLKNLEDALNKLFAYDYEIIVVVDGRTDNTYQKAKNLASRKIKVFEYEQNEGKGYAVKYGMLKARGDLIGFIDAGMDIDTGGIAMLLNHMDWYDAEIIVGSKLHQVSQVNYPFTRKILSWGYRTFTRTLFGFEVRDTQVGLKFFKRQVVLDVFPRLLVKKFAFDVEILAVAYALGYKRIFEAPIRLDFTGVTSLKSSNLWRSVLFMIVDNFATLYRIKTGYYRKLKNVKEPKKNS